MFRGYLREHPPIFQLAVFIGIWSTLQLITFFLIPKVLHWIQNDATMTLETAATQNSFAFLVINGLSSFLCFVLPPILFASVAAPKMLPYLHIRGDHAGRWMLALVLALGMVLFFPAIGYLLNQINWGDAARTNMEALKDRNNALFAERTPAALARNLLFLALLPALGEELFFRGMVQRFANSWLRSPMKAIIATSVFFALIHLQIINLIPIFLASVILGYIFHITGNLLLTIFIHFVYNGLQVVLRYFSTGSTEASAWMQVLGMLVGGALLMGIAIWFFKKNKTPLPRLWGVHEPFLEKKEGN